MFPKLRQERLKAITKSTKAREQILLYYTTNKRCLLTNNPDPKGSSACTGRACEQTRSRGGGLRHRAAAAAAEDADGPRAALACCQGKARPSPAALVGHFPPRCPVVAFGNFLAFHIFCWSSLLKKGSRKWKKHMFSESREAVSDSLHSMPCKMAQLFFFSRKKRFPRASLDTQFQTDW